MSACNTEDMDTSSDSDVSTASETKTDSEDDDELQPMPTGRNVKMSQRIVENVQKDRRQKKKNAKVKLLHTSWPKPRSKPSTNEEVLPLTASTLLAWMC